jgi:hypothetical protein
LRALAIALEALATKDRELAAREAEIYAKTLHIEKLRATLALMKRARFGHFSERIEQLELLIGDLEEEAAAQQARRDAAGDRRPSQTGEPRARGRRSGTAHLPREGVVHEAERSLPLLADLKDFLAAALASISRKSSLAGAIRYSLTLPLHSRRPARDDQQFCRARDPATRDEAFILPPFFKYLEILKAGSRARRDTDGPWRQSRRRPVLSADRTP